MLTGFGALAVNLVQIHLPLAWCQTPSDPMGGERERRERGDREKEKEKEREVNGLQETKRDRKESGFQKHMTLGQWGGRDRV